METYTCGKCTFGNRRQARHHMEVVISRDRECGVQRRASIYWCDKCVGFHVGHKLPKGKKAAAITPRVREDRACP